MDDGSGCATCATSTHFVHLKINATESIFIEIFHSSFVLGDILQVLSLNTLVIKLSLEVFLSVFVISIYEFISFDLRCE